MKQTSGLTKLNYAFVLLLGLMCILQVPAYAEKSQQQHAEPFKGNSAWFKLWYHLVPTEMTK